MINFGGTVGPLLPLFFLNKIIKVTPRKHSNMDKAVIVVVPSSFREEDDDDDDVSAFPLKVETISSHEGPPYPSGHLHSCTKVVSSM